MSTIKNEHASSEVKKKSKTGSSRTSTDLGKKSVRTSKTTEQKLTSLKTSSKSKLTTKATEDGRDPRKTNAQISDENKVPTNIARNQASSSVLKRSNNLLTTKPKDSTKTKISTSKTSKDMKDTSSRTSSRRPNVETTTHNSSTRSSSLRTTDAKRTSKTKVSETTDSSRATRMPYFPSKSIYSNALPDETIKKIRKSETNQSTPKDQKIKSSRSVTGKKASVTLEQNSIREFIKEKRHEKQNVRKSSPDSSSMSDRPGTATLKKGKFVNKNIAGPEAPKLTKAKIIRQSKEGNKIKTERPVAKPATKSQIIKEPKKSEQNGAEKSLEESLIIDEDISHPDVSELSENNIPELKVEETPPVASKPGSPDENQYEDDFESYESDFEAYSSSSPTNSSSSEKSGQSSTVISDNDEEREYASTSKQSETTSEVKSPKKNISTAIIEDDKDSGHFELHDYKHKHMLENIRECIKKENANIEQARTNPASLSDEGFEDSKSIQSVSLLAQKKLQRQTILESRKKRGEDLMSMITLDIVNYTILELPSVPYDIFIKTYGKTNSIQCYTQTGEDDISEEIQTDKIETSDMWTQNPTVLSRRNYEDTSEFWKSHTSDVIGVGGNEVNKPDKSVNTTYLEKFISSAGTLMLEILTETTRNISNNLQKNERDIPFCDGYISLQTDFIKDLRGRPVRDVSFCSTNPFKILTAHGLKDGIDDSEISTRSVLCLWNLSDNSKPEKVLSVFGDLTCCSFGFDDIHFVFGGLQDGSVAVWNTKESNYVYENLSGFVCSEICFRMPTFMTEVGEGHLSRVVRVQPLGDTEDMKSNEKYFNTITTREICTLEENGDIIVWSIVRKYNNMTTKTISNVEGSVPPWVSVYLVKNILISLEQMYPDLMDLQCTDLVINNLDPNHVYVATNYGYILSCLANGSKNGLKKFGSDFRSQASCIEACPFSPKFFICGYEDGNLSLFSRDRKKPLNVLLLEKENLRKCEIETVRWSPQNPFLLYVRDQTNTIHAWDLYESDMFPIYSVPFQENITSMALSTTKKLSQDNKGVTYMALGTEDGLVHVHVLNETIFESSRNSRDTNLNKFFNYVNRL